MFHSKICNRVSIKLKLVIIILCLINLLWEFLGTMLGIGMVRYGTVRYGTVRYGTVRCGTVRYGTVRCGTVRYGTVRYGTVRYGSVRYGTVRYGTGRDGTVRYGTVRYGIIASYLLSQRLPDVVQRRLHSALCRRRYSVHLYSAVCPANHVTVVGRKHLGLAPKTASVKVVLHLVEFAAF
jgi:hypothetical protein